MRELNVKDKKLKISDMRFATKRLSCHFHRACHFHESGNLSYVGADSCFRRNDSLVALWSNPNSFLAFYLSHLTLA